MPSDVARMLAIKSENVLKALSLTGMTLSTSESPVFVPTTANPAYSAGDDLRLLLPPFWNASSGVSASQWGFGRKEIHLMALAHRWMGAGVGVARS